MPQNANALVAPDLKTFLSDVKMALPAMIDASVAASATSASLSTEGGATFNLYFGDLGGQELYAVSLYPKRTRIVPGSTVRPEIIVAFAAQNRDLPDDPRNSVGLWFDVSQNVTFPDITATLPGRAEAVDLGKQYNQIAIFDLGRLEEIESGGTGEDVPNLPREAERLPPLESSRGIPNANTTRGAAHADESGR